MSCLTTQELVPQIIQLISLLSVREFLPGATTLSTYTGFLNFSY